MVIKYPVSNETVLLFCTAFFCPKEPPLDGLLSRYLNNNKIVAFYWKKEFLATKNLKHGIC